MKQFTITAILLSALLSANFANAGSESYRGFYSYDDSDDVYSRKRSEPINPYITLTACVAGAWAGLGLAFKGSNINDNVYEMLRRIDDYPAFSSATPRQMKRLTKLAGKLKAFQNKGGAKALTYGGGAVVAGVMLMCTFGSLQAQEVVNNPTKALASNEDFQLLTMLHGTDRALELMAAQAKGATPEEIAKKLSAFADSAAAKVAGEPTSTSVVE